MIQLSGKLQWPSLQCRMHGWRGCHGHLQLHGAEGILLMEGKESGRRLGRESIRVEEKA